MPQLWFFVVFRQWSVDESAGLRSLRPDRDTGSIDLGDEGERPAQTTALLSGG
jgi:hypothetical protein